MRFAASNGPVDRIVAAFVLAYATWTIYVHALVATQASFTTLLRGLPLATVAAAAAIAGWFRLREPPQAVTAPADDGNVAVRGGRLSPVVLVAAAAWVALLDAGMPYPAFWWGALLGTGAAWAWQLGGRPAPRPSAPARADAAWVSPPLVLALPLFAGFAWLATRVFGREQSRASRAYVADMTRLFWHGEDFPRRLRHVRSFGRQQAEHGDWTGMARRLALGRRRQLELAAHGRLLLELLATLAIAGGLLLAHRWKGIDQATLIALCLLFGRLLPYLASARPGIQQLRSALPAFELWLHYMGLPAEQAPAAAPGAGAPATIHVRRLRLRLPPHQAALEVRDLVLAPGELTLVHGDSGIGKSCLVDVLAGMSPPAAFQAEAAGRPIDFDGYRALVARGAYLSQQVRPWHASVRECLRWADPGADEAAMWQALDDVGLARRLARAGDGLDTTLHGARSRLSGGELQRLLLAQVLLRQPVLAMLDEATGALDAESEREVLDTLRRRLPRTVLVLVSHRTALAGIADQRLLLDGGGVATPVRPRRAAVV